MMHAGMAALSLRDPARPAAALRRPGRAPIRGPAPPRRGPLKAIGGFFGALTRLVLATSLFFGALAAGSYFLVGYLIRGEEIETPDLMGRPVADALQILKRHGLSLELEREEPSDLLAAGEILSQQPPPGKRIKRRATVRVVLSSGMRLVSLPEELIGLPRLQAGIRLRELGLEVGKVAYLPSVGRGHEIVLALDPPAGTGVPPGSPVNLLVSTEGPVQPR